MAPWRRSLCAPHVPTDVVGGVVGQALEPGSTRRILMSVYARDGAITAAFEAVDDMTRPGFTAHPSGGPPALAAGVAPSFGRTPAQVAHSSWLTTAEYRSLVVLSTTSPVGVAWL
jgi:hypothetical protein